MVRLDVMLRYLPECCRVCVANVSLSSSESCDKTIEPISEIMGIALRDPYTACLDGQFVPVFHSQIPVAAKELGGQVHRWLLLCIQNASIA